MSEALSSSRRRALTTVISVLLAVVGLFMCMQQITAYSNSNFRRLQGSVESGIPRDLSQFVPSYEPTHQPTTHQPTNAEDTANPTPTVYGSQTRAPTPTAGVLTFNPTPTAGVTDTFAPTEDRTKAPTEESKTRAPTEEFTGALTEEAN